MKRFYSFTVGLYSVFNFSCASEVFPYVGEVDSPGGNCLADICEDHYVIGMAENRADGVCFEPMREACEGTGSFSQECIDELCTIEEIVDISLVFGSDCGEFFDDLCDGKK